MIKVDEVSDGVFQVAFTGIDLRAITRAARLKHNDRDTVVCFMLRTGVYKYYKGLYSERSQDGLDRENERVGRG